ncbi:hypothetical protein ACXM2N_08940 [Corynebacterium sp. ZY180755]
MSRACAGTLNRISCSTNDAAATAWSIPRSAEDGTPAFLGDPSSHHDPVVGALGTVLPA